MLTKPKPPPDPSATKDLTKVAARLAADETMHWSLLANALGKPVSMAALSFGA